MASQKGESEELGEKRKSAMDDDKSELDHQQQQQIPVSGGIPSDIEMTDPTPVGAGSVPTPGGAPSSTTAAVVASSTSSSITPSSSSSATSSSTSNLRDLENLVKQQQTPGGGGIGGGKTLSSSSSSSNVVVNNLSNNNNNCPLPTTAGAGANPSSTPNCSSDLRRTQHESEDPDSVSVPRICPAVNCPEKIVFGLDLSSEMEQMKFLSRAGDRFNTLQLVKRTMGLFLQSKHRLDNRHEFGLVTVHESAAWFRDFTTDPRDISNLLEDLDQTIECTALDIGSLLKVILRRVELPVLEDPAVPPPYIVRVILIIGRSQSRLVLEQEVHQLLAMAPYLFIDVFYVHEPPSENNFCEQIFDQLCSLDVRGQSYIFEVSKNLTKLYDNMGQLLAHPLQRPLQKDISNRIRANMEEG